MNNTLKYYREDRSSVLCVLEGALLDSESFLRFSTVTAYNR